MTSKTHFFFVLAASLVLVMLYIMAVTSGAVGEYSSLIHDWISAIPCGGLQRDTV